MTIAAAALKVIPPKKKWTVEVMLAEGQKVIDVRAREWAEVVALLDAIIGGPFHVLRAY